jgi:hypothetical protein
VILPITRTLNYHGTLTPGIRNALKAAKESFTWTFLLKPQAAVPGADGVVLVVDGEPDWACEYVRLESLEPDHVRLALSSVMHGKPTVTMAEQLENMMGLFGVVEVTEDDRKALAVSAMSRTLGLDKP